jgi:hypothetical protein
MPLVPLRKSALPTVQMKKLPLDLARADVIIEHIWIPVCQVSDYEGIFDNMLGSLTCDHSRFGDLIDASFVTALCSGKEDHLL